MREEPKKTAPETRLMDSPEDLKGKRSNTAGKKGGTSFLKRGLVLLVLLAAAAGIYVFSGQVRPEQTEQPAATAAPDERVTLIDRAREDALGVRVEKNGPAYTVLRGTDALDDAVAHHTLKERPDFDLDQGKAEAMLTCAAHLTAMRQVAEKAENPADYGLAAPQARVTMLYRDGTETAWLLGDKAPTSTAFYWMKEGEEAVYLLYASAAQSLNMERNAMHTLRLPATLDAARIRNLEIGRSGQDTVEIGYSTDEEADRGYSISAFRLRQPFYYTANAERATELFTAVAGMKLSAFAGAPDELQNTGLEEGGSRYRLTITQAKTVENENDTETFVFRVGNRTGDGKSVYLAVDDSPAVYLAEAASVRFLEEATPAYLVDTFANLINIRAVKRIDIHAGEESWLLEIDHGADEKTPDTFRVNGQTVADGSAFRRLYQRIIGLTSSRLSEDYHLDGEVLLSVRYTLETDPGEILLEYIDYDADYCAVRRDGLTLFLMKKEQLTPLLTDLRAFEAGE